MHKHLELTTPPTPCIHESSHILEWRWSGAHFHQLPPLTHTMGSPLNTNAKYSLSIIPFKCLIAGEDQCHEVIHMLLKMQLVSELSGSNPPIDICHADVCWYAQGHKGIEVRMILGSDKGQRWMPRRVIKIRCHALKQPFSKKWMLSLHQVSQLPGSTPLPTPVDIYPTDVG